MSDEKPYRPKPCGCCGVSHYSDRRVHCDNYDTNCHRPICSCLCEACRTIVPSPLEKIAELEDKLKEPVECIDCGTVGRMRKPVPSVLEIIKDVDRNVESLEREASARSARVLSAEIRDLAAVSVELAHALTLAVTTEFGQERLEALQRWDRYVQKAAGSDGSQEEAGGT